MYSTFDVSKAATLASTLAVTGAATLASTLAVTGAATMYSTFDVSKAATLASTLTVAETTTLNGSSTVLKSGAAHSITHTANAVDQDLTIEQVGGFDSSLFINSAGTGSSDAIAITASAGGMQIKSANTMSISTTASNANISFATHGNGTVILGAASATSLAVTNNVTSADPTADTHLTTKSYVDGLSINVKASVKAATIATGSLATAFADGQLVDGIPLVTGDRILIKDQTTASENGIYVVTATAPTRAGDFSASGTYKGAFTFVEQGTVNAASGFVCTTTGTITIGTTSIAFTQYSSAQLGSGSVTTAKILDANVTAAKLAPDSVITAKILDANVTVAKLAPDSVITAKILDANVTTAKIADGAVTNAKIADGTINLTTKVTGVLPAANGGTGSFNTLSTSTTLAIGNNLINAGSLTATLPAPTMGAIITIYSPSNSYIIDATNVTTTKNTGSISANTVTVCIGTGTNYDNWAIYASGVEKPLA
jgi:hypothetical protein